MDLAAVFEDRRDIGAFFTDAVVYRGRFSTKTGAFICKLRVSEHRVEQGGMQ